MSRPSPNPLPKTWPFLIRGHGVVRDVLKLDCNTGLFARRAHAGMMIIVGQLAKTGIFEVMTGSLVKVSNGDKFRLTVILCTLTAVLSALLDNVTTMILLAPVTIEVRRSVNLHLVLRLHHACVYVFLRVGITICDDNDGCLRVLMPVSPCSRSTWFAQMAHALKVDPVPLLVAQTLFSNIGGTATLIGDPPNIIVGSAFSGEITFVDFLAHMLPGVVVMFVPCMLFLKVLFGEGLSGKLDHFQEALTLCGSYKIKNQKTLNQSAIVLAGVLLLFITHGVHHIDPSW